MTIGDATIDILDGGGAVVVPGNTVQLVIGTASSGTAARVVATRNPNTLVSEFTSGPLVQAAALTIAKGGTVLAMRAATVVDPTTTDVVFTGSGTSVITVTGTPVDDAQYRLRVIKGGTRGTTGITFRLSGDAGRHEGPTLALGTATSFAISGTGLTLNFAAGTLVAGDKAQFSTTAPVWDTGSVAACLDAIRASQYAVAGWGSAHLVGSLDGSDATTVGTHLESLATTFQLYQRLIMASRDVVLQTAWGGDGGETEAEWMADVAADFAAVSARRILVTAGHYNMASAYPNIHLGSPAYRRPLSWAVAARRVTIPPQRHDGRARDGSLDNINIDPTTDPGDGFVYHDEFFNPGMTEARFCAARTRRRRPGYFVTQPNLMSPLGSVFSILPRGNVMDIACDIVQQKGDDEINEDLSLNPNGTLLEPDARGIETVMNNALTAEMTSKKMINGSTVVVNREADVGATSKVPVAVTIFGRGYVLEEDITIGFADPSAAGG